MSSYSHRRRKASHARAQMSEGDKRKHGGEANDAVSESQKKAREIDAEEVTDHEVEEFFAILRRINAAVRYFKSGNDRVAKAGTRPERRWRASLEESIKQEVNGVKGESKREENVKENTSLDLNLSPLPE
ncbi:hypothetical protein L6164_001750 [Bauhinia variegata]|uniref:Uncharacterized protein n=1 Tax=Bauhinia variegata TaxID=167791 RepID=A0ACB9QCX9_BAUVA|nr:hypothetical protein L6164_001750 [Bauhinia variegata]